MMGELFDAAKISPRELTAIGFAAGPGSFTGIRISAAVCQALAIGAGASVVPLESSLLLAHAARRQQLLAGIGVGGVQAVVRSRARFAYLGSFEFRGAGDFERVADDTLMDDEVLLAQPLPAGWVRVMDASPDEATAMGAIQTTLEVADMLALTEQAVTLGKSLPAEAAQPRYVQGDTPWQPADTTRAK